MRGLTQKLYEIAEEASKNSGTSYDSYIEIFTQYCDEEFGNKMLTSAYQKRAMPYGYVPREERRQQMCQQEWQR